MSGGHILGVLRGGASPMSMTNHGSFVPSAFTRKLSQYWNDKFDDHALGICKWCQNQKNHSNAAMTTTVSINISKFNILTLYGHTKTPEHRTIIHQYSDWYIGR